jgi:hypothetical protein
MLKSLQKLFKTKLNSVEEVLTDLQTEEAFNLTNITFFSAVKITQTVHTTETLYVGYKDLTDKLGLGLGAIEVRELLKVDTNLYEIRITPLDYDNFNLPIEYQIDYLLVAEVIIVDLSIKNIPTLESFGVQKTPLEMPMTKEMVRDVLSKKYNVAFGKTIGI